MYKLVAVGGKLRGDEFPLEEGENFIGRDDSNEIVLAVKGISKKHLSITVTGDVAYVEDLGSANGTFINGKLVKRATVKNGDQLALPNLILQIVFVAEKKVLVKRKVVSDEDEEEDFFSGGEPPGSIPGKIIWMFQYKLMPIVHGINEEYEWKILFGILLSIFCVTTIALTIFPVLQDNKNILLYETSRRGAHYADEIARINRRALEQRQLDKLDTKFLEVEEGVKEYRLFDLEGRIVRPMEKLNDYIDDYFSVYVRDWAERTRDQPNVVYKKLLDNNEIGIGKKIMAFNAKLGELEPVGIISIKFSPKSLKISATKNSKAYFEALSTTIIVAVIFFGIIYYLTLKPLKEISFQTDMALRGRRKNVKTRYKFEELKIIQDSINTLLQRIRELSNEEKDDFAEEESDEIYVSQLGEFLRGSGVPSIVLDSQKNLAFINSEAEDITGIRESASQGMNIMDVSRERGFSGTVLELCDSSANSNGTHQEGTYELSGHDYVINVVSLIGKDSHAKAYYLTFVMES